MFDLDRIAELTANLCALRDRLSDLGPSELTTDEFLASDRADREQRRAFGRAQLHVAEAVCDLNRLTGLVLGEVELPLPPPAVYYPGYGPEAVQ